MAALNFQKWIVPKIEKGNKPGTIRQKRRRPIKIGELLYLYTGMRTKHCRQLLFSPKVHYGSIPIRITEDAIYLSDVALFESMKDPFAKLDGFKSYADFLTFFRDTYGLPFEGVWILWNRKTYEEATDYIMHRNGAVITFLNE
jgi:hypothetical protein